MTFPAYRCDSCRWFQPMHESDWPTADRPAGECRRHPPVILVYDEWSDHYRRWPIVEDLDFCGEFTQVDEQPT